MPCAAGELCHIQDLTPKAPDGHTCRGVHAIRLDEQDVLMGEIIDAVVREGSVSDSESEDGGDEGAGVGDIAAPPSYAQVSSQSDALESFAESNNDEAVYYARMSFLKAYACKPARQADIREFGSA